MDILKHLNGLMEFRSYSDDRETCKAALRYVINLAKEFSLDAALGKHGDVGIVDLGEGSEIIGILVHVDVVEEGNPSLWNHDPFCLTEENGILYGRGIVDDKGPVISCLYAMKEIKDKKIPLTKKLRMIIGTTEEITWSDMDHYKEEFELPDYGFTPDGNFPIYNQENGYMDVELVFTEQIPEGWGEFTAGSASNSIPSCASCLKNGQKVEFTGKAAHSSAPELGINAINLMCESLKNQCDLNFVKVINQFFPEGTYHSNYVFKCKDEMPHTKEDLTIVPTVLRQKGNKIFINFNVRQKFTLTGARICAALREKEAEFGYTTVMIECQESIRVDEHKPWIDRMKKVTEQYGMVPECRSASGCSYAKAMPEIVGWGPVFPEGPDCAHMENEQQSLEAFLKTVEIYRDYMILEGQSEPVGGNYE